MQDDIRPGKEELQELLGNEYMQTDHKTTEQGVKTNNGNKKTLNALELLYDIPLHVSVEVGRSKVLLRELLEIEEGHIIELDKRADEPLEIYVNSRLVAKGEAVMVGEKFGICLTDIVKGFDR